MLFASNVKIRKYMQLEKFFSGQENHNCSDQNMAHDNDQGCPAKSCELLALVNKPFSDIQVELTAKVIAN